MRPEPLPADFPPYRFLRLLGQGGLGTVYQVEDTRRHLRAALKAGRPNLDASARERFRTEARALQQLDHPNIVRLYDSGDLPDGRPFLVTEWLEGAELAALLRSGARLETKDALRLARSVARGLGAAHQNGILHLDVKPANIWVPQRAGSLQLDEAKLIDFSVFARVDIDTGKTRAGSVVGTPYYMSPEQVRGESLTAAADVYSLGAVMYEMLAGRRPFEGKNTFEMFRAILSQEPAPLEAPIPADVARLVQRCLAKDPMTRPASGTQVTAVLEQFLQGENRPLPVAPAITAAAPAAAPGGSEITLHGVPASPPPAAQAEPVPVRQPRTKAPTLAAIAIVLSLIALVGLALTLSLNRSQHPIPVPVAPTEHPSPASSPPAGPSDWLLIASGVALIGAGLAMGLAIRRHLADRRDQLSGSVSALLGGARTREALSMTLSLQMDELMQKCQQMDEKFLGLTMALMVKEYAAAQQFDDRQKALMNAVTILEKLEPKLSPWYVRHDKLIASAVSMVGILSGLATAAQSVAKLVRGAP